MAAATTTTKVARVRERWEAHPYGQDSQDAIGACATVCVFIAWMFCALPRHLKTPDPADMSNLVIAACRRWKLSSRQQDWQDITQALQNNFFLRMAIVGKDRLLRPDGPRPKYFDIQTELERPVFLSVFGNYEEDTPITQFFHQPACAIICDGTYTYLLCKRFLESRGEGCLEYFFFDPHGDRSLVVGFETAADCTAFFKQHTQIGLEGSPKNVDWNWILCADLPPEVFEEKERNHRESLITIQSSSSRKRKR